MPRFSWKKLVNEKVLPDIRRLLADDTLIDTHKTALNDAINAVQVVYSDISKITIPKEVTRQLTAQLRANIHNYVQSEKDIQDMKDDLKKLLENIIKIAHHLTAISTGIKPLVAAVGPNGINEFNMHKVADALTEIKKIERTSYGRAHNITAIKRALKEIDQFIAKFDKLQSTQKKTYQIEINIGKLMEEAGRQMGDVFEKTRVAAKVKMQHFPRLKTALNNIVKIIFDVHHEEDELGTAFKRTLKHIKHI